MARAYVLAGGMGTRLQGRIGNLPKALAPFAGRPFLDVQLEWLATGGVADVVLALGVGAAAVIEHLRARPASALPRVAWSVEPAPLGTGGALAAGGTRRGRRLPGGQRGHAGRGGLRQAVRAPRGGRRGGDLRPASASATSRRAGASRWTPRAR